MQTVGAESGRKDRVGEGDEMNKGASSEPTFFECLASMLVGSFPIFLLFGFAAVFGAATVIFNGQRVYGWIALVDAILLNVVWVLVFAVLQKFGFLLLGVMRNRKARVRIP
jgi:hypothetical protein